MNKYLVTRHIVLKSGDEVVFNFECHANSSEQAISQTRYSTTKSDKLPNGELTDYTNDRGERVYWTALPVELIDNNKKAPELEDNNNLDEITTNTKERNNMCKYFDKNKTYNTDEIVDTYFSVCPNHPYKDKRSARCTVNKTINKLGIEPTNGQKSHRVFSGINAEKVVDELLSRPSKHEIPDELNITLRGEYVSKYKQFMEVKGFKVNVAAAEWLVDYYNKSVERGLTTPEDKPTPNGEAFLLPERLRTDVRKYAKLLNCKDEDIYARAVKYYLTRLGKMTLEEFLNVKEGGTNA